MRCSGDPEGRQLAVELLMGVALQHRLGFRTGFPVA